ncbi:unknown [Ruminococcus sp. CAG:353]|nr:unknown [Ruminococcus sp. CAG:353]
MTVCIKKVICAFFGKVQTAVFGYKVLLSEIYKHCAVSIGFACCGNGELCSAFFIDVREYYLTVSSQHIAVPACIFKVVLIQSLYRLGGYEPAFYDSKALQVRIA